MACAAATQLSLPMERKMGLSGLTKNRISGRAILHAYDATQISSELWNSNMNAGRDQLGTGIGFGTPVVVNGKVIVTSDTVVTIYGLLN